MSIWIALENQMFAFMQEAKSAKDYARLRKYVHEPWEHENIFRTISSEAADLYQQLCEPLTPQHCLKKGVIYRCGYCGEWLKKRLDTHKGKYVLDHPVRQDWADCENYRLSGQSLVNVSCYYKKYSLKNFEGAHIFLPHPMFYKYFGYPNKYENDTQQELLQRGYERFVESKYFLLNGQHDVLDFALYRPDEHAVYFWDAKCWNGHWQTSPYFIECLIEKFIAKRELIQESSEGKQLRAKWKTRLEHTNKPYHYTRYGLIFPTKLNPTVRRQLEHNGIHVEVVYAKHVRSRKI